MLTLGASPAEVLPAMRAQPAVAEITTSLVDEEFTRLGRLVAMGTGGWKEYDFSRTVLRRDLGDEQAFDYARTLNNLYDSAAGLAEVFPSRFGDGIVKGTRTLISNMIPVLASHVSGNFVTGGRFTLRSGRERQMLLKGDEPIQLLQQLDHAFRKLNHAVTSPDARAVLGTNDPGFRQYRFVDAATGLPPTVMLYNRPRGDYRYDEAREYGRPGKGVDASISYIVQLSDDAPIPLTRHDQPDDTISIRLDRETSGDPADPEGVVSLDIGSILGPPEVFGTKIAMLLSRGAEIRMFIEDEERPDYDSGLNHVQFYWQKQYGQDGAFAEASAQVDAQLESKLIYRAGLQRVYRGAARAALVSS